MLCVSRIGYWHNFSFLKDRLPQPGFSTIPLRIQVQSVSFMVILAKQFKLTISTYLPLSIIQSLILMATFVIDLL